MTFIIEESKINKIEYLLHDGMKGEISFCKRLNIRIRHVTEAEIRAKMGGKTA